MKKVIYSIKKVRGNSDDKISGLGFLNEEGTLLCKCVSKNGKRYTRAFDDVEQHCFPVFGKENEYKGYMTMYTNTKAEISRLNTRYGSKWYKEDLRMINLNEIAFIDTDGFDYNDGECLVRFDTVMYCPDKKLITFAVTKQGRISVLDYQVFEDERGHYIEYGNTYEKIYIDETEACK